jgi:hypothetical protein
LPVRVGRSSSAGQSSGPLRAVFFVDALCVAAFSAGVDVTEAEDSTAAGVGMTVCVELGDAESATGYPAAGGDGFA